jgi:hypothetical protein
MKFEARADESVGLCRFLILISPLAAMEKRVSLSLTARRATKGHSGITTVARACIHNQHHLTHFLYLQVAGGATTTGLLLRWSAM